MKHIYFTRNSPWDQFNTARNPPPGDGSAAPSRPDEQRGVARPEGEYTDLVTGELSQEMTEEGEEESHAITDGPDARCANARPGRRIPLTQRPGEIVLPRGPGVRVSAARRPGR